MMQYVSHDSKKVEEIIIARVKGDWDMLGRIKCTIDKYKRIRDEWVRKKLDIAVPTAIPRDKAAVEATVVGASKDPPY